MIAGVGTDIIEITRIRGLLKGAVGERFLQRLLTAKERKLCESHRARIHEFVAGRFAAKEAVVKALGCGIGKEVGFGDMEIMPDERGKPVCRLSAQALARLGLPLQARIHLSISHCEAYATAFAVLETQGQI